MPSIYEEGLPEVERGHGHLIGECLTRVAMEVNDFASAVALADFAISLDCGPRPDAEDDDALFASYERRRVVLSWALLAGRQGAIAIYNVHELLQAINKLLGGAPTVREHMDRQAMSAANRLHKESFPNFPELRFTVAHAGMFTSAPERHRPEGQDLFVSNSLIDRHFVTHANGKNASYQLGSDTAATLEKIADYLAEAFKPAERLTRALWREQILGTRQPPAPDSPPPQ